MSLITSLRTYSNVEGGGRDGGGVDGELHQAMLIGSSIGIIVCFTCCDVDKFIWHGDTFPIH